MAITWTVTTIAKVPGLASLPVDGAVSLAGDNEVAFEFEVAAGVTKEVDFGSIDKTKIVAYIFHSSVTAVTTNTNAVDASGGNTFALTAAKAIEWDNTQVVSSQITQNVTKIFVINTGAKTTVFRGAFLSQL
jgi:hypothetical protein